MKMKNRLNIAITFDYELFLGENFFEPNTVLFEPTDRIIQILKERDCTATFFADVCSVYQHEKYELWEYSQKFSEQLKNIAKNGCDVQLHIHPNWLCSKYCQDHWEFDNKSYRIHYFDESKNCEHSMESIIDYGVNYLKDTLCPSMDEYQCIAYRAGGFAIQPHSKLFRVLRKQGVYLDSSVVVNDKLDKALCSYDFSNTPEQLNWWISEKSLMEEEKIQDNRLLWEVPVMTVKNNLLERVCVSKNKRSYQYGERKGRPIQTVQRKGQGWEMRVKHLIHYNQTYRKLSMDAMNYRYMADKLNKIYQKYKNCNIYFAIIGHPKAFGGEAYDNFANLLDWFLQNQDKYRLVNMTDIYRDIANNI